MKKPALDNIHIVLSHTSHPGNIGAAARAMKTMGLYRLALVNPKQFPDPVADAMACGASDLFAEAKVCATLEEALEGATFVVGLTARRRDLSHRMVTVREAAPQLAEHAARQPVAVVFGTEMSGLTNAELDKCQLLATIPANPEYSSLNLAAAVQIVAYELRLAAAEQTQPEETPRELASFEDTERFYRHLEQTLYDTGFLDPKQPKRLMQRLRRLFARARMEKEEVNILRGILTAVNPSRPNHV